MKLAGTMAEERRGARVTLAPWALVLAALLLVPFAEASLPRAAETDGAVLRVASLAEPSRLTALAASDDVERFALFAGDELAPELAPLASRVRENRFSLHLGADVFDVESLRGPPPLSEDLCQGDDECLAGTRIGGLELEGSFFTAGRPRLSLELQWACSVSRCGLADGKPLDPWGLQGALPAQVEETVQEGIRFLSHGEVRASLTLLAGGGGAASVSPASGLVRKAAAPVAVGVGLGLSAGALVNTVADLIDAKADAALAGVYCGRGSTGAQVDSPQQVTSDFVSYPRGISWRGVGLVS